MGRSLGSASVCEIISKRIESLDKCIIESGFGTEYPLLDLLNIDPEIIGYSKSDGFENLSKIKKYKKPIYFIHASMDHIIPLSEAELMLELCESNKKYLLSSYDNSSVSLTTGGIMTKTWLGFLVMLVLDITFQLCFL